MTQVPSTLTANGLTADATLCTSEEDRAARYLKELIAMNPDRYSLVEYELNGGELASSAPAVYDKETGIQTLPTVEREGYLFLGWYLNDELQENYLEYFKELSLYIIAGEKKLEELKKELKKLKILLSLNVVN